MIVKFDGIEIVFIVLQKVLRVSIKGMLFEVIYLLCILNYVVYILE